MAKRVKHSIGQKASIGDGAERFNVSSGYAKKVAVDETLDETFDDSDDEEQLLEEKNPPKPTAATRSVLTPPTVSSILTPTTPSPTLNKRQYNSRASSDDFLSIFQLSMVQEKKDREEERKEQREAREEQREARDAMLKVV